MDEVTQKQVFNYVRLSHLISNYGPNSLRTLFRKLYKQTTQTEWDNGSPALCQAFVNGKSLNLGKKQLELVNSGDIYQWDISLLSAILLKILTLRKDVESTPGGVFEAVEELRDVRNFVEHLPDRLIPDEDYIKKWNSAKMALLHLGVPEKDIEHVQTTSKLQGLDLKSTLVDEQNTQKARGMAKAAAECGLKKRFQDAIDIFSKALLLFGLPSEFKAVLYNTRCAVYLRVLEDNSELQTLSDDEIKWYLEAAASDASVSTEEQPLSWKGHYLAGKVLQLQKRWNEAINEFEHAISLTPNSKLALNARDECRFDKECEPSSGHLDPLNDPNGFQLSSILTISLIEYDFKIKGIDRCIPVLEKFLVSPFPILRNMACVFMGNRYLNGHHASLDLKMAAELFFQAALNDSPEGTYRLGMCLITGNGVKRNIPEGVRLIEKAAKMPLSKQSGTLNLLYDLGIAESQSMLATFYYDGIGKKINFTTAAKWYTLAANQGIGRASNNLARMYNFGVFGVTRSPRRALDFWKLAVEQGYPMATLNVARNYAENWDLTRADIWYQRHSESCYASSAVSNTNYQASIEQNKKMIEAFTKTLPEHVLRSRIPVHILIKRFIKLHHPEVDIIKRICLYNVNPQPSSKLRKEHSTFSKFIFHRKAIKQRAAAGGQYARAILQTLLDAKQGWSLISAILLPAGNSPADPKEIKMGALIKMASCYSSAELVFDLLPELKAKLLAVATDFIEDCNKSEIDKAARICRLHLTLSEYKDT